MLNPYFQIESLRDFNAKFDPEWLPRSIVVTGAASMPKVGAALRERRGLPQRAGRRPLPRPGGPRMTHADVLVELDLLSSKAEPGRECAFLVLLAFLATFLFIRTSARLIRDPNITWWPGNVETGGVHIHHLVWGIWLVLLSGFAAFVSDLYAPWWQVTAIAFGIGAGLTLDEFALWLHLEDVYWTEEGRRRSTRSSSSRCSPAWS